MRRIKGGRAWITVFLGEPESRSDLLNRLFQQTRLFMAGLI